MATITATSMGGTGERAMVETTLVGTDDFVYVSSSKSILILRNPTAGALTPKIDGGDGTIVPVAGLGDVSVADGKTLASIAAGAVAVVPLDTIRKYLKGTIAVTGGTGLIASLLEY